MHDSRAVALSNTALQVPSPPAYLRQCVSSLALSLQPLQPPIGPLDTAHRVRLGRCCSTAVPEARDRQIGQSSTNATSLAGPILNPVHVADDQVTVQCREIRV